ncbi:DUF4864 domain-containing protein [Thalassococcus lentus]|uniref:DUF4864 domain-containing protein n=1 Tax=Thalassococcus lentus TaxID=1210524 RepID=A0ABT4XX00_9RHOB|nr:DUF4864 domain-containing protein [Thalassococcus lentus]MDA7426495.1 DUF4864 domain-containing protein [Thalassococcus lentus]
MRRFVLSLIAFAAMTGALWAQEILSPDPEIEATIAQQIEAFKADDFDTAFSFAAPNIQNMFRTPENFGTMVQRGYPMVWRPDDLRFGNLTELGGRYFQTVIVVDAQGVTHALAYAMIRQDGQWRIAGVQFIPPPDVSA